MYKMGNVSTETKTLKKDSKWNVRNKYFNRDDECLWWAHEQTGDKWGEKRPKLKSNEEKRATHYPRNVGLLPKV